MTNFNSDITALLREWQSGDENALNKLMPLLYEDMYRIARSRMRHERSNHTLQATALVNEAFFQVVDMKLNFDDRCHFLAICSNVMRRALVDYARKRSSKKNQSPTLIQFDDSADDPLDIIDIDRSLNRLYKIDTKKHDMLVLYYFGGMTMEQIGQEMSIAKRTLEREMQFARAWLISDINQEANPS